MQQCHLLRVSCMYSDQLMAIGIAMNSGPPERIKSCSSFYEIQALEFFSLQLLDAMSSRPFSPETMAALRKGSCTLITVMQFQFINLIAKTLHSLKCKSYTCAASLSYTGWFSSNSHMFLRRFLKTYKIQ